MGYSLGTSISLVSLSRGWGMDPTRITWRQSAPRWGVTTADHRSPPCLICRTCSSPCPAPSCPVLTPWSVRDRGGIRGGNGWMLVPLLTEYIANWLGLLHRIYNTPVSVRKEIPQSDISPHAWNIFFIKIWILIYHWMVCYIKPSCHCVRLKYSEINYIQLTYTQQWGFIVESALVYFTHLKLINMSSIRWTVL